MQIQSSRFGWLSVEDDRVLTFPRGLLGFPDHARFALIRSGTTGGGAGEGFFWLQSVDDAALAFVVTDPALFFKDYAVPVRDDAAADLGLTGTDAAGRAAGVQVFAICNKVGDWLTGNLLGPIVANPATRLATQVVLTEKKWTTRQPLMRLVPQQVQLAKSA